MPKRQMTSQLTPMRDALLCEQQRLYQIADRLCNEYWDSYYQHRENNHNEVVRYTVTAYKRTAGIEIKWRRRKFVKGRNGWYARDVCRARSKTTKT